MADSILAPGEQLTAEQVAQLALNVGFSPSEAAQLVAIAENESGFNAGILNNTPATGDYSVGLYQINYYGGLDQSRTAAFGPPAELAANPQAQTDAAYQLYKQSGWAPWQADFNNGTAQANLAAGQQAVAAAQAAGGSSAGAGPSGSGAYLTSGGISGGVAGAAGALQTISPAVSTILGLVDGKGNPISAAEKDARLLALVFTAEPWIRGAEIIGGGLLAIGSIGFLTAALLERAPVKKLTKGPVGFALGALGGAGATKKRSAPRTAPEPAAAHVEYRRSVSAAQRANTAAHQQYRMSVREYRRAQGDAGDELFEATRGASSENRHYYRQVTGAAPRRHSRPRGAGLGSKNLYGD